VGIVVLACRHAPPAAGIADPYAALVAEGEQLVRADRLAEAAEVFARAAASRPDGIEAAYGLALVDARHCFLEGARCEPCVAGFDRVIAREPYRYAYLDRASCLLDLGRTEAARSDLDRAVAQHPDDPDGWVSRADARLRLGDTAGACADLASAAALGWVPAHPLPPACTPPVP
jgi:predicted Zn-dependent protease